jgi:hypothetical protein
MGRHLIIDLEVYIGGRKCRKERVGGYVCAPALDIMLRPRASGNIKTKGG